MEMREHSSIGVFLIFAGEGYEHLTGMNCESGHDPMIALLALMSLRRPCLIFELIKEIDLCRNGSWNCVNAMIPKQTEFVHGIGLDW